MCGNIITPTTDESVKPLLLFLLTDLRANRNQNVYKLSFNYFVIMIVYFSNRKIILI